MPSALPLRLREWCARRGLTQEAAAALLGVSVTTVARAWIDYQGYTSKTLERYAERGGCAPWEFLGYVHGPDVDQPPEFMEIIALCQRLSPAALRTLVATARGLESAGMTREGP